MVLMNMDYNLTELTMKIRRSLLDMSDKAQFSMHWGSQLSCVEIFAVMYALILNHEETDNTKKDIFILSKGHAAAALYATMDALGILDADLFDYQQDGSKLSELIEYNKDLQFECSGGSLGMGLSYAVGKALLAKKRKYSFYTYVLVGDGEMNEGVVWESIMAAAHYKLNNLIMIVDCNKFQSDGLTNEIMSLGKINDKLIAFGWDVDEVDGHDCSQLFNVLTNIQATDKPRAIIANTVKGKGFSFMEKNNDWRDRVIRKDEREMAFQEVNKDA